jgi:X-X-X-Leu-X-X-Gly heptad repeat protein
MNGTSELTNGTSQLMNGTSELTNGNSKKPYLATNSSYY